VKWDDLFADCSIPEIRVKSAGFELKVAAAGELKVQSEDQRKG
jgi:hypothetical protein